MKALPADIRSSSMASFGAVVEMSLQPENQKVEPVRAKESGLNYRKMLDALDRTQVEKEAKASLSPF